MPGGVNSPVRAFKSVGGEPFFVQRADGAYLFDVDGNRYIDYVGSWGPMIVGHAHPQVLEAVSAHDARRPVASARPNPLEVTMAETHHAAGAELRDGAHGQLRHRGHAVGDPRWRAAPPGATASSSSRAATTATATRFLVKAGSGALTLGVPTSPGVPKALADLTLDPALQRLRRRRRALFDAVRRRHRRPDRRAGGRQRQLPAAARRLPAAPARAVHAARRAADLRRSDDRLPRRARRRAGALRHHAGPDAPSARSSAAACRWAPTAAAAT